MRSLRIARPRAFLVVAVLGLLGSSWADRRAAAQGSPADPFGAAPSNAERSAMHARVRFPAALPPPELAQRPAVRRDTNADAAATDPYGRYPVRQASNDEPVRMPAAPAGQPTAAPPAAALPRGPSTSLPPAPLPNSAGAGRLPPPNTLPPSTTSPATPLQPAPTSAVAADAALRTPARAATTPSTGLAAGRPGEKSAEGPQAPTLVVEKAAPPEIQVGKPAVF